MQNLHLLLKNMPDVALLESKDVLDLIIQDFENKTNIDKKRLINKLILQASVLKPQFCLNLLNYYCYDYKLNYRAIHNVFQYFCIKKNSKELFPKIVILFNSIFCPTDSYLNFITYKNLLNLKCSVKQLKKSIFLFYNYYQKLDKYNQTYMFFMEIVIVIYKHYISFLPLKDRRLFINILFKIMLIDIKNLTLFNDQICHMVKRQDKPYIIALDMFFSNWNLIRPKYKKILKEQVKKRIKKYTAIRGSYNEGIFSQYGKNVLNNLFHLAEVL